MKQILHDHRLENMAVPTVELSQHQANLRRVLVSHATQRADPKIPILQGVISFMNKRTLFTGAGVAGVLALAVVTVSSFTTPPVSAMQLAQDSAKALQATGLAEKDVAGMSEQEVTYKKYAPQFASWLADAQQADDLLVLSYDDVLKTYVNASKADSAESLRIIDNPADGQAPDVHKLKYLAFTLIEGSAKTNIVIGVNEHDVPEAALMQVVTPGQPRG